MRKLGLNFQGDFRNKAGTIKFNLPVFAFRENNIHFIYSPALDLTGYGNTEEEAKSSFHEALGQFLDYTTNKKTFQSELKKLGWKIKKSGSKPPSLIDMINNNKYLAEIFEDKQYHKFDQTVSMPAIV